LLQHASTHDPPSHEPERHPPALHPLSPSDSEPERRARGRSWTSWGTKRCIRVLGGGLRLVRDDSVDDLLRIDRSSPAQGFALVVLPTRRISE
jgi:hypothetical protein